MSEAVSLLKQIRDLIDEQRRALWAINKRLSEMTDPEMTLFRAQAIQNGKGNGRGKREASDEGSAECTACGATMSPETAWQHDLIGCDEWARIYGGDRSMKPEDAAADA